MTNRRGLRQADAEVWQKVAQTVRAHDRANKLPTPAQPKSDITNSTPAPAAAPGKPISPFTIGALSRSGTTAAFAPPVNPPRLDTKAQAALRKGKLNPEARLDLHGLTLSQAHQALSQFISKSHFEGRRLVLVITGKGKERADHDLMPSRLGLLRHQVPRWLQMAPLDRHVLHLGPAHLRHGGEGACYVYLRRRGKGVIER
jgi:DNA-nicking Smr family endonuclease